MYVHVCTCACIRVIEFCIFFLPSSKFTAVFFLIYKVFVIVLLLTVLWDAMPFSLVNRYPSVHQTTYCHIPQDLNLSTAARHWIVQLSKLYFNIPLSTDS